MKLSVIVPVYNLENCVSATLESLLSCAVPFEYEIIVVNDGSTDKSGEVVEAYARKWETVRLLNIENGGVSHARNVGLQEARGEFITFVDGDDTVEPDFFNTAVREMEAGGYDFVQCNFKILSGGQSRYVQFNPEDRVLTDRDRMLELFFGCDKTINNSVCGKVFRKELLNGRAFDTALRIAEDQKFVFDLLLSAQKIKLLRMVGYVYIRRSASAMQTLDRKRADDILRVLAYCREKTESALVRSYIDADRLDVLFFIYHDSVLSGEDADAIFREIASVDRRELKQVLSRKAYGKAALICRCRGMYDLIVRAVMRERRR